MMRPVLLAVAAVALFGSAGASAQANLNPNTGGFLRDAPGAADNGDMARSYDFGSDRRGAAIDGMMRQVRARCANDSRFAQRDCAGYKRELQGAFARYRAQVTARS